jgi:hypothetical protein
MAIAHPSPEQEIREALEARDALAAALTAAGIQLPAMDVCTPWLGDLDSDGHEAGNEAGKGAGHGEGGRRARYALVQLGVCSAPVARALAVVIARGAAR